MRQTNMDEHWDWFASSFSYGPYGLSLSAVLMGVWVHGAGSTSLMVSGWIKAGTSQHGTGRHGFHLAFTCHLSLRLVEVPGHKL